MELCTAQAIQKVPTNHGLCAPVASDAPVLPKPYISHRQTPITRRYSLHARSIMLRNVFLSPKATTSEDTSSEASKFVGEKRDGTIILEDVKAADKNVFNETVATEDTKEQLPEEEQATSFNFLDDLNIKFDADDAGSIALYGGGAIAVLWITSAVISAIDSIPLFPKLLEVVGLGYTLWFSSRYLLFKKNRDELAAKIEELKEQILGSEDK